MLIVSWNWLSVSEHALSNGALSETLSHKAEESRWKDNRLSGRRVSSPLRFVSVVGRRHAISDRRVMTVNKIVVTRLRRIVQFAPRCPADRRNLPVRYTTWPHLLDVGHPRIAFIDAPAAEQLGRIRTTDNYTLLDSKPVILWGQAWRVCLWIATEWSLLINAWLFNIHMIFSRPY